MRLIDRIGHIGLRVPDLPACVAHATGVLGMRVTERSDQRVLLTGGPEHHTLEYIRDTRACLDHLGLEACPGALPEIRARAAAAGAQLLPGQPSDLGEGIRLLGPAGHEFHVYTSMGTAPSRPQTALSEAPWLGHFTIRADPIAPTVKLLVDGLGFRISDDVGDGWFVFLRCNADHHGIGVQTGPPGLGHYAWALPDVARLAALCDRLDHHQVPLLWGPLRHGAGRNIAIYHQEPSGAIIEHYTDMLQIHDDNYQPGRWRATDRRWYSLWTPGVPEGFRGIVLPNLSRDNPVRTP